MKCPVILTIYSYSTRWTRTGVCVAPKTLMRRFSSARSPRGQGRSLLSSCDPPVWVRVHLSGKLRRGWEVLHEVEIQYLVALSGASSYCSVKSLLVAVRAEEERSALMLARGLSSGGHGCATLTSGVRELPPPPVPTWSSSQTSALRSTSWS